MILDSGNSGRSVVLDDDQFELDLQCLRVVEQVKCPKLVERAPKNYGT